MAAHVMNRNPRRHFAIAIVKRNAAGEHVSHQIDDVIAGVRVLERRLTHVASRGVGHLTVLDMEPRGREVAQGAGVVVV